MSKSEKDKILAKIGSKKSASTLAAEAIIGKVESEKPTKPKTVKSTYKSTYLDKETMKVSIRVEPRLYDYIMKRFGPRGFTKFFNAAGKQFKKEIEKSENT